MEINPLNALSIIISRKSKGTMNKKTGNVQSGVHRGKIGTREKQ
jgi:hypothetical protein